MKKTPDGPRSTRTRVNALMVAGNLLIPPSYVQCFASCSDNNNTLEFNGRLPRNEVPHVSSVEGCVYRSPVVLFIFVNEMR